MTPPDGPDREVPYRDPLAPPGQAPPGQAEPAGGPLPPDFAGAEPEFRPYYKLPVGSVLGDSLGAYFGSFIQYSLLASIALLPVIVWAVMVLHDLDVGDFSFGGNLAYHILGISVAALLLQPVATGAIIYGVFRKRSGKGASFGRCLGVGFSRLLPLLGVTLLTALGLVAIAIPIFIAAMIPFLGILLVIAGLVPIAMFLTAVYAAPPATVVERKGPVEALRRSFDLTRGNRPRIFAIILVLGIAQQVFDYIAEKALIDPNSVTGFGDLDGLITSFKTYIGVTLGLSVVFSAIGAVASALVFYHLKINLEGSDAEELASVFD
jgi:hypothetical protein